MAPEAHSSGLPNLSGPCWYLRVASHLCVCTSLTLRNRMSFFTAWNSLLTIPTQISQLVQILFVSHTSLRTTHQVHRQTGSLKKSFFSPSCVETKVKTLKFMLQQSLSLIRENVHTWESHLQSSVTGFCLSVYPNDSHAKWIYYNYYIKDIQNSVTKMLFHYTEYTVSLIDKWIYLYQVILTKIAVIKPGICLA